MKSSASVYSFVGSSLALIALFIASATPIPLYGLYREVDGLTYQDLSLSSVVYFVGALTSLMILGRLSNHWGRRWTTLFALLLGIIGCASMLFIHDATPLLIGRFFQGLSCGLASSAVASWIVDTSDRIPKWVAPAIVGCGPMTGLTIGGVGSGLLVDHTGDPRHIPFFITIGLMALIMLMVAFGKETVERVSGVVQSLKPDIALPEPARKAFPIAAVTFVCTWALGGFFQAFGPAMAREQLHSDSAVAAALVFASVMAPSFIGASIAGRFKPRQVQVFGMLAFTLCLGGLLLSLKLGTLSAFLLASVLAGTAQGAILTGSIRSMVAELTTEQRAGAFSIIYFTSYTGAAVPTLLAGQFSSHFTLLEIACAYGVLAAVGCLIVILGLRHQTRKRAYA
ncbi:MFS transporter [Marinomonas ostreistagni]|uniref:MFS transporter n=1 Tax=Marinomonas ostreistagni TaxID=359209 RepID=UPI00195170DA|nr:MFS transporter [Marinomonas ostreistagni]MBM6550406.1 MFS transporter [Marinomonas ostreistagni]